jgi:Tfp pilus assembly protein PilE
MTKRLPEHLKTELDDFDKELLRAKLEQPQATLVELAARYDKNFKTIYLRTSQPLFQRTLKEYQKEALQIVLDARTKAARKLVKLIDSNSENVSARVCIAMLADVLPSEKVEINHKGQINLISSIPRPELSKTVVTEDALLLPSNGNGNGEH